MKAALVSKTHSPTSKYLPKYPCISLDSATACVLGLHIVSSKKIFYSVVALPVYTYVRPVVRLTPAKTVETKTRSTEKCTSLPN